VGHEAGLNETTAQGSNQESMILLTGNIFLFSKDCLAEPLCVNG
jgi:hypothetical protein